MLICMRLCSNPLVNVLLDSKKNTAVLENLLLLVGDPEIYSTERGLAETMGSAMTLGWPPHLLSIWTGKGEYCQLFGSSLSGWFRYQSYGASWCTSESGYTMCRWQRQRQCQWQMSTAETTNGCWGRTDERMVHRTHTGGIYIFWTVLEQTRFRLF